MYLFKCFARLCVVATTLIVFAVPASAQSWGGIYAGGLVGWNSSDNEGIFTGTSAVNYSQELSAFSGGVYGGININVGSVVFGVEGDLTFLNSDDAQSFSTNNLGITNTFNYGVQQSLSGNVRARLGVLLTNDILMYAAGGLAVGKFDSTVALTVSGGGNEVTSNAAEDKLLLGYTIGGGAEMKLTSALVLRVEYLYTDFGLEEFALPVISGATTVPATNDTDLSSHAVRVGIAIKF